MIKEDKIGVEFKTLAGKDYRTAEEVKKIEIENFFQQQGFKVLNIKQIWRHVHGKLEKEGRIYFFKMSSTPGISERTRNEATWNS